MRQEEASGEPTIFSSTYGRTALAFLIASLATFILLLLLTIYPSLLSVFPPKLYDFLVPMFTTFITLFVISLLHAKDFYHRVYEQRPKVAIAGIDYFRFERSIRIFAVVKNEGRIVAKYVKPLITIDKSLDQLVYAEYSKGGGASPCMKGGRMCRICKDENKPFLCPPSFEAGEEHPRWKVEKEPLSWMIPEVEAGKGLEGKPYCHVTNVAPGDSQKVVIADVYRSEEEKACVIKIADEYGIDWKPRICYRVDLDRGTTIRFLLELVGEGFGYIKKEGELEVAMDELRVRLEGGYERLISGFKEIKAFPAPSLLRK
jgi:hypothetical protein